MTIRVGVIGCGFYAQNHLNSWHELEVGGCASDRRLRCRSAKAEAAGRNFGVPHTPTRLEMLDGGKARRGRHRHPPRDAPAAGRTGDRQGRRGHRRKNPSRPRGTTAWRSSTPPPRPGIWLAVHENFRFQTPMRHVKRVIDSGAIGRPTWARINFRTGFDIYKTQPYFYDEEAPGDCRCRHPCA